MGFDIMELCSFIISPPMFPKICDAMPKRRPNCLLINGYGGDLSKIEGALGTGIRTFIPDNAAMPWYP